MLYRKLGDTGLEVSVLSFGNWITGHSKENQEIQNECVKLAWEAGVNYFDTAENYGEGKAEVVMGKALKALNVKRSNLVISTKIFWSVMGDKFKVNLIGLSRKHILEGIRDSLKKMQLEYVDVVFCHRPDHSTPLEEVCRGMSQIITEGKAFYWGTSEWPACMIAAAVEICKRLKLHGPKVEQCEYNMLERRKMESEYCFLFSQYNLGTTVFSPLKSGLLSGKYNSGEKLENTRFATYPFCQKLWEKFMSEEDKKNIILEKLRKVKEVADEVGCSMPQLALAWTVANKRTTTCIMGASKVEQLKENLKCLDVLKKWDRDLEKKIEGVLGNRPDSWVDFKKWQPMRGVRESNLYEHG
jgi:voltage-dependent potassium channel beta subunit